MDKIRVMATDPIWGVQRDEVSMVIHDASACKGRHCTFHNPSKHHMLGWQKNIRMDKRAFVERICPHDVGHPDPDSLAYFVSIGDDVMGVHGCDGCCWEDEGE